MASIRLCTSDSTCAHHGIHLIRRVFHLLCSGLQLVLRHLCGGVVFLVTALGTGTAEGNSERLSNLSDGNFARQLPLPPSQNVEPNTPLMEKAMQTYNGLPFAYGERIRYIGNYLGLKIGNVEMLLRNPIKWKSGWAHRITAEAKSAEWYGWLVKLHESIECIVDPELNPLRFYINQLESNFEQTKIVTFDAGARKIFEQTKRKGRDPKREEFELVPNAKDALGALYYFRSRLAKNDNKASFEFPIFTSEKTWTAKARHLRDEKRKVEGVEYDTMVYELHTQFGGHLEQKGQVKLWVTRDERFLPVHIEATVAFGSFKLSLTHWDQGFGDPKLKKTFEKIKPK